MESWLAANWDKIVTVLVSIPIAGIIGFYTSIISVKSDLSNLRERLARIEEKILSAEEDMKIVREYDAKFNELEREVFIIGELKKNFNGIEEEMKIIRFNAYSHLSRMPTGQQPPHSIDWKYRGR